MSKEELEKLENLLVNMEDIKEQLRPWLNRVNLFEILQIGKQEIRHSNFLSYLFNPSGSHKLGDIFLKQFLQRFYNMNPEIIEEKTSFSIFDLLLGDFNDAIIYREHHNIDLFIVSERNSLTICIENKIDAIESSHQLAKYQHYVSSHYSDYTNLLVFLTPDGTEPSSVDWGIITYNEVIDIMSQLVERGDLDSKVEIILTDYMMTVRRDILMDSELERICRKIYVEYQEALDLIFEVRPDKLSILRDMYIEALKELSLEGKVVFNESFSNKSVIRFQLQELNDIFSELSTEIKGGWGNHQNYAFEIFNRDNQSGRMRISFTSTESSEIKKHVEEKLAMIKVYRRKENWKWWTFGKWHIKPVNKDFEDNLFSYLAENNHEDVVQEIKCGIEAEISKALKMFQPILLESEEAE